MRIFLTGVAGFIGFHIARRFLAEGHTVSGVDDVNPYYDPRLKHARLSILQKYPSFSFSQLDIAEPERLLSFFRSSKCSHVVHLAAQAGVRYSLTNPAAYIQANLVGFANVLEACRHHPVEHLVFASSSSVYGLNSLVPFSTQQHVNHPVSLYAATKIGNEAMAHAYSHLYRIPSTGLRFFTVYGPWGRPDMSPFIFANAILHDKELPVYNNGMMERDFTYIDDIVESVYRITQLPARSSDRWDSRHPDPSRSTAPYRLYNIGNSQPVPLLDFISLLAQELGKPAKIKFLPMQPGDVVATSADTTPLAEAIDFMPQTPLHEGLQQFCEWYRSFYQL